MRAIVCGGRGYAPPFVVYRQNKGYFYGPGAGSELAGKAIRWGAPKPHVAPETTEEKR